VQHIDGKHPLGASFKSHLTRDYGLQARQLSRGGLCPENFEHLRLLV